MIKCPFCHYDNEDGALFCERCSSDLSTVAPVPAAAGKPPVPPIPFPEPPIALAEPLAEPFAEPLAEPFAEPFAEPLAEPFAEPLAEPFAEPLPADFGKAPVPMAEPLAEPFAAPVPAMELSPSAPPAAPPPPPMESAVSAPPAPPPVAPSPPPAPPVAPAAAPSPSPPAPGPAPVALPPGAEPRLVVLRGQKRNAEYLIFEGLNYVGRADEKPVDIDLEEQEPPDRIWCSRQHAVISLDNGVLTLEDLNSANGTYVNRVRVYPGQPKVLAAKDIIQIGNVQMRVEI